MLNYSGSILRDRKSLFESQKWLYIDVTFMITFQRVKYAFCSQKIELKLFSKENFLSEKINFLYRFDYHSKLFWKYSKRQAGSRYSSLGNDFITMVYIRYHFKGSTKDFPFPQKIDFKIFLLKIFLESLFYPTFDKN